MEEVLRIDYVKYGLIKNACGVFNGGRIYVITGQSAAEKAILLSLMGGLELPAGGNIFFKGKNIASINRDDWRIDNVGLILQKYALNPNLTATENAMLPMEAKGMCLKECKKAARDMLGKLGLDKSKYSLKVSKLNRSDQFGVSLSRVLAISPVLYLIETGILSMESGFESKIMDILSDVVHDTGACVIIASNSRGLADRADEVWGIKDGILLPVKTG